MFAAFKDLFKNSQKEADQATIESLRKKILKLKASLSELKHENRALEEQCAKWEEELSGSRNREKQLQKVLSEYDLSIKKLIHKKNKEKNKKTSKLTNLESSYKELVEKYEKAKDVIQGFQKNEEVFREQIKQYQGFLANLKLDVKKSPVVQKIDACTATSVDNLEGTPSKPTKEKAEVNNEVLDNMLPSLHFDE